MKIIFLDIDGVLNSESAYRNGECQYVEWEHLEGPLKGEKGHHQAFAKKSKMLLNSLIKMTGAKVVISSTWRMSGIDAMKRIWEVEEMEGEIIGITPNLRTREYTVPRGCEIDYFLREIGFYHINWSEEEQLAVMEKSGVENYIIIDDDSDMLYGQRNHFVHVLPSPRNKDGFNEHFFETSMSKLSKNIVKLNYK